jgi:hypothetical protein
MIEPKMSRVAKKKSVVQNGGNSALQIAYPYYTLNP